MYRNFNSERGSVATEISQGLVYVAVLAIIGLWVIAHLEGNCHVYVDRAADFAMAERILLNAKCQRPGVCNAAESLIVHPESGIGIKDAPTTTCTWTASIDQPWMILNDSPGPATISGTGSSVVTLQTTDNHTGAFRFGTFTIGGQTFKVTQEFY